MPTGSTNVHPHLRMTIPTSRIFMNDFVFLFSEFSYFCDFFGAARRSGERDGRKEKERQRNRAQRANPTALSVDRTGSLPEQSSGARRDKRAARGAIRGKLSEQMPAGGANIKSETCQLARKLCVASHSRSQRAKSINRARGGVI